MSKSALPVSRKKRSLFTRCLDLIENVGNRIPHPASIFALLAMVVVLLSGLATWLNLTATHPLDGSIIRVNNLLSADGLRYIFTSITPNFVNFPPLGYVLAAMIGIGLAEGSGYISALIRGVVLSAPSRLITLTVVFAGVLSSLASEVGYVVLIPLGALIFHSFGRHPIAGLAAAFAGVSGGFGANLMIGAIDPVIAGLSQSAAHILDPSVVVNPAVNYYFMASSTLIIVLVGAFVTERFVEKRLGSYDGAPVELGKLTKQEWKGLIAASIGILATLVLFALLVLPEGAVLRNPETGAIVNSPFFDGLITAIILIFFIPGIIYGAISGSIKNDKDAVKLITKSMAGLAGYIVLVFFAGQFVYFFRHSNLGLIMAIQGALFLQSIGLTGILLAIAFILMSSVINLFMGSASAKWAIMAPIFVPMFMLLGFHPSLTQAAYRIGDSVTNLVTPMMSYFALIVAFAQKYGDKYGMGTIIATMLPYSLAFLIVWTIMLVLWMLVGFPLGPGGPLHYVLPG